MPTPLLSPTDHNRDVLGMRYVYPVVSRRAGGVSVGINLNDNNACNWRCIYCNVPNLKRGVAPDIDLRILEIELRSMLQSIEHGDFMRQHVPPEYQQLQDIAFSGNGEPTSAKAFLAVLHLLEKLLIEFALLGKIKVRLITNGSLVGQTNVQQAIQKLAALNGEVWFKLDAASQAGIAQVNDVHLSPQAHIERLSICAQLCPTFVQTCLFALDGNSPRDADIAAYTRLLEPIAPLLKGVYLYSLARTSLQPEADRLTRLSALQLEAFATHIRQTGLAVYVHA